MYLGKGGGAFAMMIILRWPGNPREVPILHTLHYVCNLATSACAVRTFGDHVSMSQYLRTTPGPLSRPHLCAHV